MVNVAVSEYTVGLATEMAVTSTVSVAYHSASMGTVTSIVKVADSRWAIVPVLPTERLVGQLFPETVRSKLPSLPVLLVTSRV